MIAQEEAHVVFMDIGQSLIKTIPVLVNKAVILNEIIVVG
jgi:hypothetical protein